MIEQSLSALFGSLTISEIDLFGKIPRHNQMDVLKKLDFKDYVKFKKCSKKSVEITKDFCHPLRMEVYDIHFQNNSLFFFVSGQNHPLDCVLEEPVRIEAEMFTIHEGMPGKRLEILKEFCQRTKIEAKQIYTTQYKPENEPSVMDDLIRIKKIEFTHGVMEDSDFLLIKNPHIEVQVSGITPSAVNNFLKQWMAGERRIERLLVGGVHCEDYSEIFKDLEATLLWSPETHESSLFSHLMDTEEAFVSRIHTLKRSDGKKLCIASTEYRLAAEEYESIEQIEKWIRSDYM